MALLEQVQAVIPEFAGYGAEAARRHSDELVRAYLGERLASFAAAHSGDLGDQGDAFDTLVVRCEFASHRGLRPFEDRDPDPAQHDALLTADLAVTALAADIGELKASEVGTFIARANAALDRREAAMRAV
jgi:hypothetical protein